MMENRKKIEWLTIGAALVCVLPFVYLCRYVHPINDDYFYAQHHIGVNPFAAVADSYANWSGRYLATFLSEWNPLVHAGHPMWSYPMVSLVIVLLFCAVPLLAFRIGLGKYLNNRQILAGGSLYLLLYLSQLPKASELFYWFSAAVAFTVPSLMALLYFALLPYRKTAVVCLQEVLAFLIPGGNEVTAVLFVLTSLFIAWQTRERRLVGLAVMACLGILVVMLSPGNGIRMGMQLSSHPYLWTVVVSTGQTVSWIFLWLPTLLLASLVYIPLVGIHLPQAKLFQIKPWVFGIFVLVSVLLAHVPSTLGLSSVVTGRTANALWFFVILYYLWGMQILINRYRERIEAICAACSNRLLLTAWFCFLFLCPLSLESPVSTAYFDLISGKAQRYDQIRTERDQRAFAHKDEKTVVYFEPLGITSKTLYAKDLETKPDEQFCRAYSQYYQLACQVAVRENNVRFTTNFETLFSLGKSARQ